MSEIVVVAKTQRIVISPPTSALPLTTSGGQQISVSPPTTSVSVVNAGPPGPPGAPGDVAVNQHITDTTPHPTYDDMNDLTLLFENGLV